MPVAYSSDTLSIGTPGVEVDRLNDALAAQGLGRPLSAPRRAGTRLIVTVSGVDPAVLRDRLPVGDVLLDPLLHNGTTYWPEGAPAPQAFAPAELSAAALPAPPPWAPIPAGMRRPVVALLDCGVLAHPWLPPAGFLLDAEDHGWDCPLPPASAGHATFIAGIIRSTAPSAQVLSVRVMDDHGVVRESTAVAALEWLLRYRQEHPVDVVCLAFGRDPGALSDRVTLADLEAAVRDLVADGAAVVASAGNDHAKNPVYPAGFHGVVAVGAGIGDYHARFSNWGGWVDRYREGIDIHGILPPDRFGRWSGTSFSVAHYAGDLARPQVL
jgi:hypothetical protein